MTVEDELAKFFEKHPDMFAVLHGVAHEARRQTLEEAAQACEARLMGDNGCEDAEARGCAAAIRALITLKGKS